MSMSHLRHSYSFGIKGQKVPHTFKLAKLIFLVLHWWNYFSSIFLNAWTQGAWIVSDWFACGHPLMLLLVVRMTWKMKIPFVPMMAFSTYIYISDIQKFKSLWLYQTTCAMAWLKVVKSSIINSSSFILLYITSFELVLECDFVP